MKYRGAVDMESVLEKRLVSGKLLEWPDHEEVTPLRRWNPWTCPYALFFLFLSPLTSFGLTVALIHLLRSYWSSP